MRELTDYAKTSNTVQFLLNRLIDTSTSHEVYAESFYLLGKALTEVINNRYDLTKSKVMLACSSEDADWLSKGILDNIDSSLLSLAVFWNLRINPFEQKRLAIAPIVKSYVEDATEVDFLIVCKSIIYTSCVVRTNLTFLIEKVNPKKIVVTAPVLFKQAEETLKNEFDKDIADKFEFIYFAKDDEVNDNDEVLPGIGGSIYQRLGLGDAIQKNRYIPSIVKERRTRH